MSDTLLTAEDSSGRIPAGLRALVGSLLINGLGPYIAYRIAAPWFPEASTVPLLISALIPAGDLAVGFARRRTVDVIAIIALVQLAVSIAITLLSDSADVALGAHALQSGALGLVFGASVLFHYPLIIPLARQTMAGGDVERQARFDAKAKLPGVRRTFARITLVWAAALCLESAMLFAAATYLPAQDYLLVSAAINYGGNGLLIWGSIRYGRRRAASAAG